MGSGDRRCSSDVPLRKKAQQGVLQQPEDAAAHIRFSTVERRGLVPGKMTRPGGSSAQQCVAMEKYGVGSAKHAVHWHREAAVRGGDATRRACAARTGCLTRERAEGGGGWASGPVVQGMVREGGWSAA
jgi:hypothetical protein